MYERITSLGVVYISEVISNLSNVLVNYTLIIIKPKIIKIIGKISSQAKPI